MAFGQSNMSDLFVKSLYRGYQDKPCLVRASSRSGNPITTWVDNLLPSGSNQYYQSDVKQPLLDLLKIKDELGKKQYCITVILNQGEADAANGQHAAWQSRVDKFRTILATDFPQETIRFMICKPQIDHSKAPAAYVEANMNAVRSASDALATAHPAFFKVFNLPISTYPRPDDGLHLRHASLRTLGQNLYTAITS